MIGGTHPRRRGCWAALATAAVIVLVVLVVLATRPSTADTAASAPPPVANTVPVVRGPLTADLTLVGTVRYTNLRALPSGRSGTLTALPRTGRVVGESGELYRVDDVPVLLLHGRLPAWRDFRADMTDGPDVEQLEAALDRLGFFYGTRDEHFTDATAQTISAWQRSLELQDTGILTLGSVFFSATDLRMGAVKTPVGSHVDPGVDVLDVSAPRVSISADVSLPDRGDAPVGARVEIQLPGGGEASGTVSEVLPPVEREDDSGTRVVVPIVVTLDDPSVVKGQDQLTLSLSVTRVVADDVLQVPVSSLLAQPGGGYGVQVRDGRGQLRMVPVTLGSFGGSLVAVEGALSEDDEVVTP